MAATTFAAIDIGSYEISMKIFEFSKKIGFRELNDVRYRVEIGKGAYSNGRLEPEMVDEICVVLGDFRKPIALSKRTVLDLCHHLRDHDNFFFLVFQAVRLRPDSAFFGCILPGAARFLRKLYRHSAVIPKHGLDITDQLDRIHFLSRLIQMKIRIKEPLRLHQTVGRIRLKIGRASCRERV